MTTASNAQARGSPRLLPGMGLLLLLSLQAAAQPLSSDPARLAAQLGGADALAEIQATQRLVQLGDGAVAALAHKAASAEPHPGRLIAVEALGRLGTPAARAALLQQLQDEKHLAVRGQICMQLGYLREKRAIPLIAQWLQTIGPRALDDVPGPKEVLPSTCYSRHIEALGMIGDESAIPILEDFAKKIPKGIGFGGFISTFVAGAVREAIEDIQDQSAFWKAVRKHPALEEKLAALFAHLRTDNLARLRLHEDPIIRHTPQGKLILQRLATHADPALAASAKALLEQWDSLGL